MDTDVTAVIPTIPPRGTTFLPRALASVMSQEHPVAAVSIAVDLDHAGADVTRGRALAAVGTTWTAFLDDDDMWYPNHVLNLLLRAAATGADYVYSYWDTTRTANYFGVPPKLHGPEEFYGHYGHPFDPDEPTHTTMTVLVRTELAKAVGFTPRPEGDVANGEDWRFTLACVAAGAKIVHLPKQTWYWCHHETEPGSGVLANTSGRGDRW